MTYLALDRAGIGYTVVDVIANSAARGYVMDELGHCTVLSWWSTKTFDYHWSGFRRDKTTTLATHLDHQYRQCPTVPTRPAAGTVVRVSAVHGR